MAIGKVNYKTGQNLEPIAQAITSMNQSSTKKDKPVEMAQKIKAISTDATAVEGNVLNGQTFYSGGSKKTGNMPNMTGIRNVSAYAKRADNSLQVQVPTGYYGAGNWTNNYQIVPLESLRSVGYALQTEVDSMTNDRNNWQNIANSRIQYSFSTGVLERKVFKFSKFMKLYINNYAVTENDGWNWFSFSRAGSSVEITLPYVYYSSATPIEFRLISGGSYVASTFAGDKKSNRGWMTLDSEYEINGYFKTYVYDPSIYGSIYIKPTAEGLEITNISISYSETLYYGAWCC